MIEPRPKISEIQSLRLGGETTEKTDRPNPGLRQKKKVQDLTTKCSSNTIVRGSIIPVLTVYNSNNNPSQVFCCTVGSIG